MLKYFKFNLFMHEDGAAASGDSAAAEGQADSSMEQTANSGNTEVSEVDTAKEYQDFKNKYKNEIKADMQKVIDRRFAKSKETEARLKEQEGVINLLHQRYGTRSTQALYEALENDEDYIDKRALELGMTREQAQLYDKMQRENQMYKALNEQNEAERQQQEQIAKWLGEAENLKAKYPEFDLETELQSEGFAAQLRAGVPVELAYKTTHFDELMQSNTAYTAQQTQKAVTENIRARGTRPVENGSSAKSGFTTSKDVSKFTAKDFADIDKRLARGEKVTFK